MAQTSPLARVKQEFGGKDKLVDQLLGLMETGEESKDDLRKRLTAAANSKLLRLHGVASTVKNDFGSHDKLVEATAEALGRSKDRDYVKKLSTLSSARVLDLLNTAKRRKRNAEKRQSK